MKWLGAWFKQRREREEMAFIEEVRRASDDFGAGPELRYGEDRWGAGTAHQVPLQKGE
jgi:hypothetical protein